MNWIERLPEIKGKDLYSQNSEGLILEYIIKAIGKDESKISILDLGSGDGFILSNSRHLKNIGHYVYEYDKLRGYFITIDSVHDFPKYCGLVSIDLDGNDYWILDALLGLWGSVKDSNHGEYWPYIIIAEFNPAYTDSRTIAYNPTHEWAGDSYYGFTFEAGCKLAEKHGYKVIFQIADMNMIMVRKDLIEGLTVPPVTFKQSTFFKMSERTDWVMV